MEILNFKGQLSDLIYILKKGGSIHIKKKNRGKFTEYCGGKVTEECIKRAKKSENPKLRKRATFAANARKWKHAKGGIISKYQDGGNFVYPNYWDNSYFKINTFNEGNKSKEEELYEKTVPEIPYRPIDYSYYPQWNIFAHGLKNINQEIEDSSVDLYSDKKATYYKDKDNNYYVFNHTGDSGVINPENFKEVPYSEIRGKLAPRDYIGGDKRDVGIKVIEKIPNLKETISKLSDLYNISKDVFTQRLINEGWLQQIASNYNSAGPNEQKNFDWNSIMNDPVYGQSQLGLDTFGDYFKAGKLNLRRNINFEDVFGQNEDKTGREYNSANFKNAYDALEAKAAVFEYFTKIAKERNIPEADINAYVNAMYNMGPYHKDLNNMDYIRRTYSVTPYFKLGGILKAQEGTGNLLAPHPLSPLGIVMNDARIQTNLKYKNIPKDELPQLLAQVESGVMKEVIDQDGKAHFIRTEQPLVPLERSIAEWMPGTGDVAEVGYIADDVKNGRYGSAALAAGLMFLPGAAARKVIDLNGIKKVNVKLEDPTKYWYVAHQTGSSNFSKIAQDGLQTGSGLNGTALRLTEEYMDDFANGRLKQKHLSHEGADGLVVMKFPKDKFPSGDLDDISIRLMELGESNFFEVPPEYLQFFKRDQFKKGGKL